LKHFAKGNFALLRLTLDPKQATGLAPFGFRQVGKTKINLRSGLPLSPLLALIRPARGGVDVESIDLTDILDLTVTSQEVEDFTDVFNDSSSANNSSSVLGVLKRQPSVLDYDATIN
jgi:hypothetical protein